jgi:hypothetical protein
VTKLKNTSDIMALLAISRHIIIELGGTGSDRGREWGDGLAWA